jgi:APA family basic amino acid/polyamine antiporter
MPVLASPVACAPINIVVAGPPTAVVTYGTLDGGSPVADVMPGLECPRTAGLIAAGARAGLTTVMLVLYFGLTRVFPAISPGGRLPPLLARGSTRSRNPSRLAVAASKV